MAYLILFLCSVLLFSCSAEQEFRSLQIDEKAKYSNFQKLNSKHKTTLADSTEQGERLLLCLTFVDKKSKSFLVNKRIYLYHANPEGEYNPRVLGQDSTARYSGYALTDSLGRIFVSSVLPGDYGSSENNRHIHLSVEDARPRAYDIFFEQYTGQIGGLLNSGNDQFFFAKLKKTKNGKLITFLRIEAKNRVLNEN